MKTPRPRRKVRSSVTRPAEKLETRRLLSTSVSGAITTNTTWTAANSPYILTAATYVRSGADLTIQPGVVVTTSNNSLLYVSDDNTAAAITASGATFDVQLVTDTSSAGSITGCTFNTAPIFNSSSPGSVPLSGNTFTAGAAAYPNYVSTLVGNSFTPNSTVSVLGGTSVSTSTTWPVIANVSQYEIVTYDSSYDSHGVHVVSGATLTLAPGVKVTTDGSSSYGVYDGIYVAEDSSGAKLNAYDAMLVAPVFIEKNAGGLIELSTFESALNISGGSTVTVEDNSLGNGGAVANGSSTQTINLTNNWWGTTSTTTIAGLITDHTDNSSLPTIDYTPVLTSDPTASQTLTLSGSASFYIRQDPDAVHTDVWTNATGTGGYAQQLLLGPAASLVVDATGGTGTVTFDNSLGNVLQAGGATVVGDGGTALSVVGTPGGDTVALNSGQFVDDGSVISFTATTQTTFNPDGGLDSVAVNAGRLIIPAPSAGSGPTVRRFSNISIAAAAELQVATAASHTDLQLILTQALSIAGTTNAWTGTLDLGGNDMDVQAGSLSIVTNQLASGDNDGNWTSTGIDSSIAATNGRHVTTLGVIQNNENGPALFGATNQLDGIIPAANDVLVKYTYYGDANFSGNVDGSDYSLIDNGYKKRLTGWENGDFNGDGVVDGTDYALIDNAFNDQQSAIPSAQVSARVATSAPAVGAVASPKPAGPAATAGPSSAKRPPVALPTVYPAVPTNALFAAGPSDPQARRRKLLTAVGLDDAATG